MELIPRVKNVLLKPKQEWQVIKEETTTTESLYKNYIIPLAAIGPLATMIGMSLVGITMPFVGTYRIPLGTAVASSLVSYAVTLVNVYILAFVINALAPTFSGTKSPLQALKVSTYASTAAWLAGIFMLIPAIGVLALLGLYSFYLFYLGLPILMKAPQEKALGYTFAVVIVGTVLFMAIGIVSGALFSFPAQPMPGMTTPFPMPAPETIPSLPMPTPETVTPSTTPSPGAELPPPTSMPGVEPPPTAPGTEPPPTPGAESRPQTPIPATE